MNPSGHFNIRVYGLLINTLKQVLITDEYRMGMYMTKFPGGGLEYGEGTIECLKREFKEELDINVSIKAHFYTTDYFQKALFFKDMQLISIYYLVESTDIDKIPTTSVINQIPKVEGAQAFRWVAIESLTPDKFTFPIDQKVLELLKATL
ncbi:NUDIX domain-containing protein [Carboxylicivirga mesophila]|uniref:NUDIX domain-containing protein n=1 Tax=Carboxylicivirga mesophila TaxID=1166478 RepID=A0ABS5KEL7_9BACT|nr:NUDIX domain-containing protein [Carboxylicivirga mesophila]MBS2213431.1 NUDIX domain-containing protein [Carboxylicivirga mesophila]